MQNLISLCLFCQSHKRLKNLLYFRCVFNCSRKMRGNHMQCTIALYMFARYCEKLILTWRGSKPDHQGASSRARLLHCTPLGLTPAIIPNANNSTVQFLVAGTCVRASPLLKINAKCPKIFYSLPSEFLRVFSGRLLSHLMRIWLVCYIACIWKLP